MSNPIIRFIMPAVVQPAVESLWLVSTIAAWGCWALVAVFFAGDSIGFELGEISDLNPMMTKVMVFGLAGWAMRCLAIGARNVSELQAR